MMVYGFNKGVNSLHRQVCDLCYVAKTQRNILRAFLIASLFISIISVPFSAVDAMGTTKASALVLEEISAGRSLSFQKNPPTAQADPCLSFLYASRPSMGVSAVSQTRRPVGKTAVAFGLVLGVRIALGPKEVVETSKRVKIGPEIRANQTIRGNHALAVAAYRSCKNEHFLGLLKNKKQ